jgi:hypothetical protein
MKIKLEHILKRNKITLKEFLEKNYINSYAKLCSYCEERNFIACNQKDFDDVLPPKKKEVALNKEVKKSEERPVNISQKKKTKRSSARKKPDSQSVSGSNK